MTTKTAQSPFTSRPYTGLSDLLRMEQFLAACTAAGSPYSYWHLGDLLWSMTYSPTINPVDQALLWEDADGQLVGFVWCDDGEIVLQVHPRWRGSGVLEEPMFTWAAQHTRERAQCAQAETGTVALATFVDETDVAYTTLLQRHGFERGPWSLVRMRRDLAAPIPASSPPTGTTLRPVREEDIEERVTVHRAAFHPSHFTREAYQRLRAAPGYRPDLDVVAVAADGRLAAYAVAWFDPITRIGLFEPIGTHPLLQRQGYGKAVMVEGLRRLHDLGAPVAFLHTGAAAEAAVKLYESVGFRVVNTEHQYKKTL